MTSTILHLSYALAERRTRQQGASALARALGAQWLLILLPDPEVEALLPAPGFPQSLPGGPAWTELLVRCRTPGRHQAVVPYPRRETLVDVHALVLEGGLVLLLLGGEPRLPEPAEIALPLIESLLRSEQRADAAAGRLASERDAARHATVLARALDSARRDLELALAESARLNTALTVAAGERTSLLESERAASRAKDEFLAMLGHELRNPLAPIVTALQILHARRDGPLSKEHAVIERQVSHLTRLVDDLLDVSRIAGGKIHLQKSPVELSAVVSKAVEMASPLLEEHHHQLRLRVPAAGCLVHADERRLTQVVTNLLTNAARYTPPGGLIRVEVARRADRVELSVRDNGAGIDPAMLPTIFELFVQSPQAKDRAQGGLGLGLAIVRNLVALHGGTVEARSAGAGQGSEFIVQLPAIAKEDLTELPAQCARPQRSSAEGRGRVLVVDDNEDAAEMLAEVLSLHGFEVKVCHDGPQALALTEPGGFVPDVALLDIGLPVMDGHELARRLRERPHLSRLRLMAATGYGQKEDLALSRDAGFAHHLVKPLSVPFLLELLDESGGGERDPDERTR